MNRKTVLKKPRALGPRKSLRIEGGFGAILIRQKQVILGRRKVLPAKGTMVNLLSE